jgi:hypothetical protein
MTATFSQETAEKALRLVHENRVTLLGAYTALVSSDGGLHHVQAFDDEVVCDCPSRRAFCAHVLSAMIVWASEDAKRAAGVVGATASGDAAKAAGPRGTPPESRVPRGHPPIERTL